VKTKAIFSKGFLSILDCRHVLARDDSQKGWQGAPLLEPCGEQARQRWAGGAATLLYLGEINSSQELAWRKSIEVLDEGADQPRTLALFPEDRCEGVLPDSSVVRLRLSQVRLSRDGALRPIELSSGFEEIKKQSDGPGTGNAAGSLIVLTPQPGPKAGAPDGPGFPVPIDHDVCECPAAGRVESLLRRNFAAWHARSGASFSRAGARP
jgi:hypothetical protein